MVNVREVLRNPKSIPMSVCWLSSQRRLALGRIDAFVPFTMFSLLPKIALLPAFASATKRRSPIFSLPFFPAETDFVVFHHVGRFSKARL